MSGMDEHRPAGAGLTARFEDPDELVGLCWPALYAFVRLVSSRRIMGDAALQPSTRACSRLGAVSTFLGTRAALPPAPTLAATARTPGLEAVPSAVRA